MLPDGRRREEARHVERAVDVVLELVDVGFAAGEARSRGGPAEASERGHGVYSRRPKRRAIASLKCNGTK